MASLLLLILSSTAHAQDAGIDISDAGFGGICNPVSQLGCEVGEKCGNLNVTDLLSQTTCVPDGTVDLGAACTVGAAGETTGYDDCKAGLHCLSGACQSICVTTPDSCTDGVCTLYNNLFEDDIGLCVPSCDPTLQDCPENQGCYLNTTRGTSACAGIPTDAANLTQGDDCYGPQAGSCFLNGCAEGFTPSLNDVSDGEGSLCAFLCNPSPTFKGASGSLGAASGEPCGTHCGSTFADRADGPGSNFECRYFQTFYNNTSNVPETIGMCVDTADWKSCKDFDLARFEQAIAENDPDSYATFCDANPAACVTGCVPLDYKAADFVEPAQCPGQEPDAGVGPFGDTDGGVDPGKKDGEDKSGCGCETGGAPGGSTLLLMLLVALGLLRKRSGSAL